jgi:hypothetical protein
MPHQWLQLFAKLLWEKKLSVWEFRYALAVLGPYPEKNMALLFEFLKTTRSLKDRFIRVYRIYWHGKLLISPFGEPLALRQCPLPPGISFFFMLQHFQVRKLRFLSERHLAKLF